MNSSDHAKSARHHADRAQRAAWMAGLCAAVAVVAWIVEVVLYLATH